MTRRRYSDRDLIDRAIEISHGRSAASPDDDPRLDGAVRFVEMIRESSFAPFEEINTSPLFLEKKKRLSRRRRLRLIIASVVTTGAAAVFAAAFFSGLFDSSPRAVIRFVSGDVLVNNSAARTGMQVKKGDSIVTGKDSSAVLVYSDTITVSLVEKSALTVSGLSQRKRPLMNVDQSYGISFVSIRPESADFRIRSHSTEVSVHGTSFLFAYGPEGVKVKLLRGKVSVARTGSGTSLELHPGQSVVSDSAGLSAPVSLSHEDEKSLNILENMAEKILKDTRSTEISESAEKILSERESVPSPSAEPGKRTLSDIGGKYGQISVVQTRSGEKYIGAISYHDRNIVVVTQNGSVTVPLSDVSRIEPYTY
jgi:hypothetical protein